jgi:surface antigen
VLLAVLVPLIVAFADVPTADARGHWLGPGPPETAYAWSTEADPAAGDPWGFVKRQCTSYAAWFLNTHGVPFAEKTRGPSGQGLFLNAGEWDLGAVEAGFLVSRRPAVGSIAQWHPRESSPVDREASEHGRSDPYLEEQDLTAGRWGHVAVVTSVLPDGSVLTAGYNGDERGLVLVHTRAPRYLYIGVRTRGEPTLGLGPPSSRAAAAPPASPTRS